VRPGCSACPESLFNGKLNQSPGVDIDVDIARITETHHTPASKTWIETIADAIEHINSGSCPEHLVNAIATLVNFDMAMSVVYSRGAKPFYVYDTFRTEKAKRGLSNYINSTYVLNPIYTAYCDGIMSGVFRLREESSRNRVNSYHYHTLKIKRILGEELEYLTEGWPQSMEEIFIAISLPADEMAEISLLRTRSKLGFTDADIAVLKAHLPLIEAIYRQYWIKARCYASIDHSEPPINYLLKTVFDDQLSCRESQVAELVLKGASGQVIADQLGISITTVKTHRKNLYLKLGITTQTELFSLALNALALHD
jgi:DNA-binding CsgD family transcriptional regulator